MSNQIVRRKPGDFIGPKPEILAPAGNRDSFLAALAAGADAIYCGLKSFSARMAAKNFTLPELSVLADLARQRKVKLYLTVNTLIKPDELAPLGGQLELIDRHIAPDALIIQDLGVAALARQVGYKGELHLSTLANMTMPQALGHLAKTFDIQRMVLPRELDVDEIKLMAAACPQNLGLEIFVHGALCYGVSGRCYWSSYMGGKSGLRGHCVQPCRRRYTQEGEAKRFFACQDFSLDVLVKTLAVVPQLRAWKIEGRKKGPHYVYYTVTAYQMLRDEGHDPQVKKAALQMLEQSLGRTGTHYYFLPQRPQNPIDTEKPSGSGLLVGAVRGSRENLYLEPRFELLPDDKLRVGYEDDGGHQTLVLNRAVPKQGKFQLPMGGKSLPAKGTPVFLIDRREAALGEKIGRLAKELDHEPILNTTPTFTLRLPPATPKRPEVQSMHVMRRPGQRLPRSSLALWLSPQALENTPAGTLSHAWWWLPPVIWPAEAELWQHVVRQLLRKGARRFVLNALWQSAFFERADDLNLWAGPFCNISNPLAVRAFKLIGGKGVIVSPELGRVDLEQLGSRSVLPLGVVVSGHWPFCVSRALAEEFKTDHPFVSPQGEEGWVHRYDNLYWVFPNWAIDLKSAQELLAKAGFRLFVHLDEPVPKAVRIKKRPGRWNWEIGLK
jgi:U32 family peptidase